MLLVACVQHKRQRQQAAEEPSLYVFARVFGTELLYRDLLPLLEEQAPRQAPRQERGEEAPSLLDMVIPRLTSEDGVRGTFGRDRQLLHTTVVLPTALGLPLRLQLDGLLATQITYGVKLDMNGQLSVDANALSGPALKLLFKPRQALLY